MGFGREEANWSKQRFALKGLTRRDCLQPQNNKKYGLDINEDPNKGFYVKGLSVFSVKNEEELMKQLRKGNSSRHFRETEMNERSSRSHTIFTIGSSKGD